MTQEPFAGWAETTLGAIGLFCGVETETLLELGARARWRRHAAGTALMRRGDIGTTFLALVEGSASVHHTGARSTETIDAGQVLGLRTALRHEAASIHIVAATPALTAEINRGALLRCMTDSPALARNVTAFLAGRGKVDQPREQIEARIVAALARAAAPTRSNRGLTPLPAPVDAPLWATLMGVDRIDVERALRRLERQRLVERRPGGTLLVDREALRRRLE